MAIVYKAVILDVKGRIVEIQQFYDYDKAVRYCEERSANYNIITYGRKDKEVDK